MPFKIKPPKAQVEVIKSTFDTHKPRFSLYYIDSKYCCLSKDCTKDEKNKFLNKILLYSKMTWREIKALPKESGYEMIEICLIGKKFPEPFNSEARLMCFRGSKQFRFWGCRKDDTLHVLLIDKTHDLT